MLWLNPLSNILLLWLPRKVTRTKIKILAIRYHFGLICSRFGYPESWSLHRYKYFIQNLVTFGIYSLLICGCGGNYLVYFLCWSLDWVASSKRVKTCNMSLLWHLFMRKCLLQSNEPPLFWTFLFNEMSVAIKCYYLYFR